MKTLFTGTIFFLFFSLELLAQGFNIFNQRNHPYLEWQVAETEHFKIMFPDRISGIEVEAAAIAEETWSALSENFQIYPEEKIRIYLSDEDEIINGFASPIGKGYTNIWVNLNDYGENFTGREKWLRKVIAHELAHIFHFKSVRSDMGLLQHLFADPLPIFWTEGVAQYQTETWNSQRGDRWLRKAIFDSRPSFRDSQSLENSRLLYASGNAQLRYFTEKYGDSSLVNLFNQRKKVLGLFEVHDFDHAFDEIVDGGYDAFYEDWRKHMNVYYNTLASQMERTDSLYSDPLRLPGQFIFDMAVSPDDSLIAVLSLVSLNRPVRRLYVVHNDSLQTSQKVAEGNINPDVSWGGDGKTLYYSRRARGERSSLVNDLYRLEPGSGKEERLTYSRRARFPTAGPGEDEISYIVNEGGTGNLFTMNVKTGEEKRITRYTGNVQLLWSLWLERQDSWLVYRFDEVGDRHMVVIDRTTGMERVLDDGDIDNRKPVISPDGAQIAFTSLRDEVPNVFIYDFESDATKRVTNLFTGGEIYGWTGETENGEGEKLLIKATETKRWDEARWVKADRGVTNLAGNMPEAYSTWRQKTPPNIIPPEIEPDAQLIIDRYRYRSFRNITHAASLGLPWYSNPDHWGIFAITTWTEPLGKHTLAAIGLFSIPDMENSSRGILSYVNNQFYPTFTTSLYKIPGSAFFYGDRFLVEELIGGDISMNLPLDGLEKSYQTSSFYARLRHVLVRPYEQGRFSDTFHKPAPERGRQTDLTLGWSIKKQRPWRDNRIHPLDGRGVKISVTGADKVLGSDVRFVTADLSTFTVLPSIGLHRFYLHGRFQAQWGTPLPQSFIGFSRWDNIRLHLPGEVPLPLFDHAERVRGHREFVAGRHVAFWSLEYRMPFLPSLETTILGLINLGATSLALFTDAGVVWDARRTDETRGTEKRWGAGIEMKNEIRLFGIRFTHALGVAKPASELLGGDEADLYYRVRAAIPF